MPRGLSEASAAEARSSAVSIQLGDWVRHGQMGCPLREIGFVVVLFILDFVLYYLLESFHWHTAMRNQVGKSVANWQVFIVTYWGIATKNVQCCSSFPRRVTGGNSYSQGLQGWT